MRLILKALYPNSGIDFISTLKVLANVIFLFGNSIQLFASVDIYPTNWLSQHGRSTNGVIKEICNLRFLFVQFGKLWAHIILLNLYVYYYIIFAFPILYIPEKLRSQ
jgi:hypothetical protein